MYGKSLLPPELEPRNVQPEASRYVDYSIPASQTVTGSVLKLMYLGLLANGLDVSLLLTLALRMTTPVSSESIQCHVAREPPDKTINNERILNLESILFLSSFFLSHELNAHMLYAFFWVIPRRLNFICRRFGTLCLFHLHRQVGAYEDGTVFRNVGI